MKKVEIAIIITIINLALFTMGMSISITKDIEAYNEGYRQGMLYAYDEVVVCNANPEERGLELARMMGVDNLSSNKCEE